MKGPTPTWIGIANAVAIVLLTSGMLFLAFSRDQPLVDELDYWALANSFAEHGELLDREGKPTAYRPPLISWILSPIVAAGGDIFVARAIYSLIGVIAAIGLFFLARRLGLPPLVQLFAILLGGFNPVFLFTSASIYPQSLLAATYVWALVLLTFRPSTAVGSALQASGIAMLLSLSLLASTSGVFVFLPILAALAWICLRGSKPIVQLSSAVSSGALVCCLLLVPYVLRNNALVHPGIYLSLNSGINLLLGNSPETKSDSGIYLNSVNQLARELKPLGEYEANKRLTAMALANIQADPKRYSILYVQKFVNGLNNSAATFHERKATAKTAIAWLAFLVLVLGAATGYWAVWRRLLPLSASTYSMISLIFVVILAAYLLNLAGYAVFFTRLRFRVPGDFLLALPAAVGYVFLFSAAIRKYRQARQQGTLPPPA